MRWKPVARPILVFVVAAALALVGCSKKEEGGSAAAAGDESGEGTMLDSARAAVAQEVDTR